MPPRPQPEADGSAARVCRGIVDGLYLGRFAPGQRLAEPDLARAFQVGRGTVREALSRLAADGIVTLALHRGALVRALARDEAHDILALLEVLVGTVARLAASRIGKRGARTALAAAVRRLHARASRRDFLHFARARDGFYRTLIEIGGNRELARVMRGMHVHLVRAQFRIAGEFARADYDRIAAAVRAGAPGRAEASARAHIRRVARAIMRLPDAAFAPPAPGRGRRRSRI